MAGRHLVGVSVASIYGGELPFPLCQVAEDCLTSFGQLQADLARHGGRLVLSDLFRPYRLQAELKRRKPRLAAAPLASYHCAGRAMDVALGLVGLDYQVLVAIMAGHHWFPLASGRERWHFQRTRDVGSGGRFASVAEAVRWVGNDAP